MVTQTDIARVEMAICTSPFNIWVISIMDQPEHQYHKCVLEFMEHFKFIVSKAGVDSAAVQMHYVYATRYGYKGAAFQANINLGWLATEMLNCAKEAAYKMGDKNIKFYRNN